MLLLPISKDGGMIWQIALTIRGSISLFPSRLTRHVNMSKTPASPACSAWMRSFTQFLINPGLTIVTGMTR
jgi:hypothetical protein